MKEQISNKELKELETYLDPLENRMDKIIKDYIIACRSHAAVSPRGDWGANDVFDDTYDMECVYELLEFLRGLMEHHGGVPRFVTREPATP